MCGLTSEYGLRSWKCRIAEAASRNPITGIAAGCASTASGHTTAAPPSSVMNSSLQDGAENAMSIRIGYLLPTRERIMANNRRRRCWNWLSELSASAYHLDVLLGERHPLLAAE